MVIEKLFIGGLQKLTLIDFPGKIATTVFTIGCNFRCPYCYNSELVMPEKIKQHPQISEADFFDFLQEHRGFLEGVCVTGGEPTIHPELVKWVKKIKAFGYLVKLDTNGSNLKMLHNLIQRKLIDYIAMDIKGPIGKYKEITSFDNIENIKKSIKIVQASGIDYEFRTTVVPSLLDKSDFILIAEWLNGSKRYFIQQFRPEKTLSAGLLNVKPYNSAELQKIRDSIKSYFEICEIRN